MSLNNEPVRLGFIEGFGATNEVIFNKPKQLPAQGWVVFFGGDMQDYKENMLAHRDNKFYAEWDLETTSSILNSRFPEQVSIVVKPSKMGLKTFSCYDNFVPSNNFGAPTYEFSTRCLKHLMLLLKNINTAIKEKLSLEKETFEILTPENEFQTSLHVIGFSKGCVVLNQLLYSLHSLAQNPDADLYSFVKHIRSMYWLEGGHSGSSETWIINKDVLNTFSQYPVEVHIDVTPYQVKCDTRPRIGKEEKVFRDTLTRLGMKLDRKIHFENEPRSLEKHFQILTSF